VPIRPELPQTLLARPQRTGTLARAGVTRQDLRGPLWTPVHRGVHVWAPDGTGAADDPTRRILAVAELMPAGAAIGGWAALHLLGVKDIDGRTGPGARVLLPIAVCLGPTGRMRRRTGIDIDRSTLLDEDRTVANGVTVTTAVRSCLDIMRWSGVEEGMVAGDAAARFGVTCGEEIRAFVARHPGMRGIPAARLAASLVDDRAESCPESRLRYVWIVEAGLPVPEVNCELVDMEGYLLGRPDLLDVEAALVGEYDGADHRDLVRQTSDNVREESFERRNLVVVRATAIDLWPRRPELVRRLQTGHRDGLARDRTRDRFGIRRRR
jgi:hypothetical protein